MTECSLTISRAYILGAGFSCHAGFPLVRNLLPSVIDIVKQMSLEKTAKGVIYTEAIPHYHKYMELKHPQAVQGYDRIGIEELMMEMSKEIENGNDVIGAIDVVRAFNLLRFGAVDYLNKLIDGVDSMDAIKNFLGKCKDCIVITFNWDTLVERAALALGLRCITTKDGSIQILNQNGEVVTELIKLHGSVQWIEKARPGGDKIRPHNESLFTLILGCVYAYNDYESIDFITPLGDIPAIVIPSKDIRASSLQPLWAEAKRRLASTNEIVVIGYSLPSYDQPSIHLLGEWMESNTLKGRSKAITIRVVDPSIEVHKRYEALFGGLSGARVSSLLSTFEESEFADSK